MDMYIYEVIVVLYYEVATIEHRMMMVSMVYRNNLLFGQHSIRFLLLPELPNINITYRPMLRLGPVQATGVALQHHYLETMLIIE